ncbi:ATP-binding protein [Novosphingobium sp.]|uniref:HAMP domain-containing sensor histidine kinase n=1 Tax=Novosphingobium sp. TaxID=1874826 RepID=UPI003D09F43E
MAVLLVGELVTLRFAMGTLSAVRAFVAGQGQWSKAQKNAAISLQRYLVAHREDDYQNFLTDLRVHAGDHVARLELAKDDPDMAIVRQGFLAGEIHPDDIDSMVDLLRRFSWIYYIHAALNVWGAGDDDIARLQELGARGHALLTQGALAPAALQGLIDEAAALNNALTAIENDFALVLGQGSRWLERVLISLLSLAVMTVEGLGLTLTLLTTRSITRGLNEICAAAQAIGHGDLERRVSINSLDELGTLATAVNSMGGMLNQSYRQLEERIAARTAELAQAVRARDDFMSIASHELKTPLTALKLQAQMRKRFLERGKLTYFTEEKLRRMVEEDDREFTRLNRLVDDMLDISRMDTGRFTMQLEPFDLAKLVTASVDRFTPQLEALGSTVTTQVEGPIDGQWDYYRVEQILTNLLPNAMKYGAGHPVHVRASCSGDTARLSVQDAGIGIAQDDQMRIFGRFERAVGGNHVSGLGLGLHIAKEIVDAHGGSISVRSQLGVGSEFIVELACAPQAPRSEH